MLKNQKKQEQHWFTYLQWIFFILSFGFIGFYLYKNREIIFSVSLEPLWSYFLVAFGFSVMTIVLMAQKIRYIYALEKSRAVIVSKTGSLTLPPEIISAIEQYGNMWNFRFEILNDNPRIIATPKSAINGVCPVCKTPIKANSSFCTSCGARLKK